MESSEIINDYPPASAIETKESKDYPFIRCKDCYEILTIHFKMDKKEIQLKCEKEGKTKNISFNKFFDVLKEYENFNCCKFCKNKNPSQNYYLCKTCSNKILCQNCFENHCKKDDVIKFKIDSTCKKHYNPYESYCPLCNENKCSYCSIDHNESHEKDEFSLKKKIFKNKKLDEFKKTINKIINEKDEVVQKINLVIKELEEKIDLLKNLKMKFLECLNMKLKVIELCINNYEKKVKDFDINYFIINNLESQFNINLLEFKLNNNTILDDKIKYITNYLNQNINSGFNSDFKDNKSYNEISLDNSLENDIIDVEYKFLQNFNYKIDGFLDFNEYLFALYSSYSIYFISKNNYETKFQINEYEINNIKICKKFNDEKILLYTGEIIIIIKIIDNNDYIIEQKIKVNQNIFDFNSNLDLIYYSYNSFSIGALSFPDYNKIKFSFNVEKNNKGLYICNRDDKIQCLGNNIIFHFTPKNLESYIIKNNKCSLENSININIAYENASIFQLNNEFYCLNDKSKILLLNKTNLSVAKTININSYKNLGILRLSNKLISVFHSNLGSLVCTNYNILSNGIKWNIDKTETLLNNNILNFSQDKKYILFFDNPSKYYYNSQGQCYLFKIETKQIQEKIEKIEKIKDKVNDQSNDSKKDISMSIQYRLIFIIIFVAFLLKKLLSK